MNWKDVIIADDKVLLGKPIIKGTRISVEFILERLANGWSNQDILDNYPQLKSEDIQAVFQYILDNIQNKLIHHHSV